MKTILFSFAHPDDETFTSGGMIARLSERNDVRIILYTATPGDAGKCGDPPICTKDELADVRKKELHQAASYLGIDEVIVDTFQDGELSEISEPILTEAVQKVIDQFQPDTVITFPPHGISGHPDHIAIQKATWMAVQESKQVKELYYATVPDSQTRAQKIGPKHGDPMDKIDMVIELDRPVKDKVRKALLAHRTQHLSVESVFPDVHEKSFKKFDDREYFILAFSRD